MDPDTFVESLRWVCWVTAFFWIFGGLAFFWSIKRQEIQLWFSKVKETTWAVAGLLGSLLIPLIVVVICLSLGGG